MKKIKVLSFLAPLFVAGSLYAEDAYKFQQVKSTTTITTSPAKLHAITITDSVAVAFTVYDSTSVDVATNPIAVFDASAAAGTYFFDIQTQNGIQHIGAANGAQVTFSYRERN